ncbi:MAG: TrkH family potassium uptake protein [Clostridiales bacterium]|nr:TrkH family potassium uptake protein [Clostridiales bacterium]
MNKGIIRYTLGRIMLVEAGLMIFPLFIGLIYRESLKSIGSFLLVMIALAVLGFAAGFKKPHSMHLYAKEGLAIASLSWLVISFFGCLPYVLSGDIPSLVDAFFEASSGFTTTGASILTDVEAMNRSNLFWRSFTQLIGGMGVLVFAMALLPNTTSGSVNIMKAEVPGPSFGKLVSKLRNTARILYLIYLIMTAVVIVLLMLGGMDWFDASLHAFGAAGTGGFGVKNTSIAFYNSAYIDLVLSISMIAFGVNFNLYYLITVRQVKKVLKDEELRWYLLIILIAVVLISINISGRYDSVLSLVRDVGFTVSSVITTTGYSTADFNTWPLFSHIILLLLMFFGACAGSTGGGLKISRVMVLWKTAAAKVFKMKQPRQAVCVRVDGSALGGDILSLISSYFLIYVFLFIVQVLLLSLDVPDFMTAFSAVAATFNNIGPGLGRVGPATNYASLSGFSKFLLSIGMITGRLEIYPVLILFIPSTWRKLR